MPSGPPSQAERSCGKGSLITGHSIYAEPVVALRHLLEDAMLGSIVVCAGDMSFVSQTVLRDVGPAKSLSSTLLIYVRTLCVRAHAQPPERLTARPRSTRPLDSMQSGSRYMGLHAAK